MSSGEMPEGLRRPNGAKPPPPPPPPSPPAFGEPDGPYEPGYAAKAFCDEVNLLAHQARGGRNVQLNASAFNLGQLIEAGALDELRVRAALESAAAVCGLTEDDGVASVLGTLNSGIGAGKAKPRDPRRLPREATDTSWLDSPATPSAASSGTNGSQPGPGSTGPSHHRPQSSNNGSASDAPPPGEETKPPPPTTEEEEARAREHSERVRAHLPRLDWPALWADKSEEEWIVEPLLPARRLIALYSAPKVGKSLLLLELAAGIASGRSVLGNPIPERTWRVLYVDFENDPRGDVRERLIDLGYGPEDLDNLVYLSFPRLAALDSVKGARELMAAVKEYECEVVVIDTVSRSVAGEESSNDTWLAFYRHTGLMLREAKVALIRLDHTGKDESKGQRGGSAKSGDVDAIWKLSTIIPDEVYKLECEDHRMPVFEKELILHREVQPLLRHRVDARGYVGGEEKAEEAIIREMDRLGIDVNLGRDKVQEALRGARIKARATVWGRAIKRRKDRERFGQS